MPIRPIHFAILAAGALLASPALAADEYPLPLMAGAVAYSDSGWEGGYEESYQTEGEVIYMDDLEEGEEWHSADYEYEDERVETVVRRDYRDGPPPPPRTGTPAWGGDRRLAYGEGERQAWLAQCRSLMSRGHDYAVDACADYLARYESGSGGYDYAYGYGQQAAHGCGSCNCGGGCGKGCGGGGGCGCTVSYRFAPMPMVPVVQPRPKAQRIVTIEEWDEEVPGKTVRVIPPPVRTVPVKIVPAAPAPVKTVKPRYSK